MADRILDSISLPEGLKDLDAAQLEKLAKEIRTEMINVTSTNGGHLGPNLGVVELTIGLHMAIESPKDKIIWDVGHQAYVHKLLTGRKDQFFTLRKYGGISGFPKQSESPHDAFDTGHASNSISVALGAAVARDLRGTDETIVAVIGDGSMTGGMAFEALNQAGHLKTNIIIVLNDNEMSINGNVGALSCYLNRIRLDPAYNKFRHDIEEVVRRIPGIGEKVVSAGETWKTSLKQLVVPGMLFEELGIKYIGPIDGHDVDAVKKGIAMAKEIDGPILIHVLTKKGLGYQPAEQFPERFHGTSPFNIKTGLPLAKKTRPSYGQVFGESLARLAIDDQKIVAVSAAMAQGTGLDIFAAAHPDRFFDVGIAEQHGVTFAAGMAQQGLKPVVAIYSTFLQRAYDQLVEDICLPGLPVVFALDRGGLVGDDGPTHHGAFDLSYLSHMPNMVVMAPKDDAELRQLMGTAFECGQPAAIRYPRGVGPEVDSKNDFTPLPLGKSEVLVKGEHVAILAIGRMVETGRAVVDLLKKEGLNCTLVNARFVKPIDTEMIFQMADSHDLLVSLEDNSIVGGFGSQVAQVVASLNQCRLVNFGLPDYFVSHGSIEQLFNEVGLDPASLSEKILAILKTYEKSEARSTLS